MNPSPIALACTGVLLAVVVGLAQAAPAAAPAPPTSAAAAPYAVVELFTSEGCSSCPPADALLARIESAASAHGQRVFALEFHVDYWDQLGWRDPYSSAAATARQRRYAERLGLDQVYTPQMVINGRSEFVGSNGARAEREIAAALARPAAVDVGLEAVPGPAGAGPTGRYRVRLTPSPGNAEVIVARVESGLASQVARGENGGRLLRHSSVVRAFAVVTAGSDGTATVMLGAPPAGRSSGPMRRVIAFVQDRASGAILGATALTAP